MVSWSPDYEHEQLTHIWMSELGKQDGLSAAVVGRSSVLFDDLYTDPGPQPADVVLHPAKPSVPALCAFAEGPCPASLADDRVDSRRDPDRRRRMHTDSSSLVKTHSKQRRRLVVVVRGEV
jgi:hypothetical protein